MDTDCEQKKLQDRKLLGNKKGGILKKVKTLHQTRGNGQIHSTHHKIENLISCFFE